MLSRFFVLLGPALLLSGAAFSQDPAPLLEEGQHLGASLPAPDRLKIVSYNIHGPQEKGVEELFGVLERHPALRDAHVLALQEVNRYRKKTGRRNVAAELAKRLKMNYVYAVENSYPESKGGGARGLAILSRLPLAGTERLELPHRGPGGRLRIGLMATVQAGATAVRLCNTHLETRLAKEKKAEQMRLILQRLRETAPAQKMIVIGDFNTITEATRKTLAAVLHEHGFTTPLRGDVKTFQRYFAVRTVLDWVYLKDLRVRDHKVEESITVSDHRPIWVEIDLSESNAADSGDTIKQGVVK